MKKLLLLIALITGFSQYSFSQTERIITPVEKRLTDSICKCLAKLDMAKITNKAQAIAAYTSCINQNLDQLTALTEEKNVEMTDMAGMKKLGVELALTLMKNKCEGFTTLSKYFAENDTNSEYNAVSSATTGTLKRIDNKGFNYVVLTENGSEKSFLWLRQFPGSEKLTHGLLTIAGKKVKIKWQEMEVYLPAAKGYYKVKEITELTFL